MNAAQVKILNQFFYQFAELASETLKAYVEKEEKQVSIVTDSHRAARPERRLINKRELAGRLGVSVRTISNLQTEGLPVVPFGKKRVQFDYDEVLIWAKDKVIKSRRKNNLRVVR